MRNYRRLYRFIATLTAFSLLCLRPIAARADLEEFTVIKLLVNVLKNVPLTIQEIEDTIKAANQILKQAKIRLEWDKTNLKIDFPDGGNGNGMADAGEIDGLLTRGLVELNLKKKEFGRGKGYKVYFTNGITHASLGPGLAGLGYHDPGLRVIFLNPFPISGAAARGNDMAHEVCHTLTLGKNHLIDDKDTPDPGDDVRADDTFHAATVDNLLFPYNNGVTIIRGTNLTPDQIAEIKGKAKQSGDTKLLDPAAASVATLNTIHGSWESPKNVDLPTSIDFTGGAFFAQAPDNVLRSTMRFRGTFPATPVDATYYLLFNTDNDESTGLSSGPIKGIEKYIAVRVNGVFPFNGPGDINKAALVDLSGGSVTAIDLPPARFERVEVIGDVPAPPDAPGAPDDYDKFEIPVSMSLFGSPADEVKVGVFSELSGGGGFKEEGMFDFTIRRAPGAQVTLNTNKATVGGSVGVMGTGYTPGSAYVVLLDDTPLASGTVGPGGTLSRTFVVPLLTPPGNYFVTVRGEAGESDYSILIAVPRTPFDVSGRTRITRGGYRFNRTTGRYVQIVTLKNIGTATLTGPLSLVLDNLGSSTGLYNKTGVTSATSPAGSPYINTAGSLAPGASVSLTLEFTNPTNAAITYSTRVLAGPGAR